MIKDTETKKPSLTATIFVIGSTIALLKLLLSGIIIFGFQIPLFTGSEFALIFTSLGGIYSLRRSKIIKDIPTDKG